MRIIHAALACSLLSLGACGKSKSPATKDDAAVTPPSDATSDAGPAVTCTPVTGSTISFRKIATVSGGAMVVVSPPNDARLFVVEQQGRLRIIANGQLVAAPFLDLTPTPGNGPVVAGGEQGLLGLAFHPSYATNGYFYVTYTAANTDAATKTDYPWVDILARYKVSATDPNTADAASGTILVSILDFAVNHNGGMLEFGKDGYLYWGTGDGGNGGDPHQNGQDPNALLGKMLRLDVDHPANSKPYGIPSDNPYATGGGAPEVFMLGLRNPWRWAFDKQTGDLWIGDVGQDQIEELDVLPAGTAKGANMGWSMYEATACCMTETGQCEKGSAAPACDPTGKTFPKWSQTHANGWDAIIGGDVYRGSCYPSIAGTYYFTDNVKGALGTATMDGSANVTVTIATSAVPSSPASIHAAAGNEMYLTDTNGNVYHLEAAP